jgi:putative membrane protein insertion efficiency factor
MQLFSFLNRILVAASIQAIRFYQRGISPLLGARCKYHPSCSAYTLEAIQKYGFVKGVFKGAWRIVRCNPFSKGGYDPP